MSATMRTTSATMLARQPIVDRTGACHGYELLFRGGPPPTEATEDDRATAGVLVAAACDIGWELLGGGRPLYLNVGTGLLFDSVLEMTPPEVTVLEVLERITVDGALVERLAELRARGFRLALDDFVPGSPAEVLVEHVDVVKVDVLEVPQQDWPRVVASVHERGALAVAEKVESETAHEAAMGAGFDLFQGYWYARPTIQRSMAMTPQRTICLRLMGVLMQPEPDPKEIEALVSSDAALVVRTLRMANSAAAGARRTIDSVRQAVVMVGPKTLAGWVALMVMAQDPGDNPLIATEVLVHARACEIVASNETPALAGQAFLAGLTLGLVERAGVPAVELLDLLGASGAIRDAVLSRSGALGRLVDDVDAHLCGREPDAPIAVQLAHLAAVAWVGELQRLV
ncbi:MAG TPA: HDOD domain-containing protein [Actinomycetales bacterium]|nr:HDOD domain-containing protein [Actinomycetales bacterium]